MKRKGPTFGHSQVDYRLQAVFKRALKDFHEADRARDEIEKMMNKDQPDESWPKFFIATERAMESGVILIMAAGAWLEQVINDCANTFLDADWYEEHLDSLRTATKWTLLPYLCQNKPISENDPAINGLREFIKARNALVHHKRRDFYENMERECSRTSTESDRFWAVCKKTEAIVDRLIKLLTDAPPQPHQG